MTGVLALDKLKTTSLATALHQFHPCSVSSKRSADPKGFAGWLSCSTYSNHFMAIWQATQTLFYEIAKTTISSPSRTLCISNMSMQKAGIVARRLPRDCQFNRSRHTNSGMRETNLVDRCWQCKLQFENCLKKCFLYPHTRPTYQLNFHMVVRLSHV